MKRKSSKKKRHGSALIFVLMTIVFVAIITLELSKISQRHVADVIHTQEAAKALAAAKAGVSLARAILKEDNRNFDALSDVWAEKTLPISVGGGEVTIEIEDEQAKLDLNRLIDPFGNINGKVKTQIERLFAGFNMSMALVEPIIDWIDADNQAHSWGAESAFYQTLKPSYLAKNGPLDTFSELRLIKGFSNLAFWKDSGDPQHFLTIYSTDGRVNINTAGVQVLASLSDALGKKIISRIIERRPFESLSEIKQIEGLADEVYQEIDGSLAVRSQFFTIKSTGRFGRSEKSITAVVYRDANEVQIIYWSEG